MAGDTYSFVIDNFQERNAGRYSISAENPSGRATCSAELASEGNDFKGNFLAPLNILKLLTPSQVTYSEEIITESSYGDGMDNLIKESKTVRESKTSGGNTVSSESKSVETIPITMQSPRSTFIPVSMKDMSIQSSNLMDLVDRASQMDAIRAVMVDESSQWSKSPDVEVERLSNLVSHGSAPFVATKEESRFASSSVNSSTNQQSFSYMKKSCSFSNQASHETQTHTQTTHHMPQQSDFSTTLIKDVNQRQHHHLHGADLSN